MKLSAPKLVNRKAVNDIFSMLVSGQVAPGIMENDTHYWVTNGYIAFSFRKQDFIFNRDLFKPMSMPEVCSSEDAFITVKPTLHKPGFRGRTVVRLESNCGKRVYLNKTYLDMFDPCCTFRITGIQNGPVCVFSEHGEMVGIIMPIRVTEDW